MSEELNLGQLQTSGLSQGQQVDQTAANQISEDISNMLDQVFDLIFMSSKQVLGNINSIGIKFGNSLDNPDHMLVVFPQEVYGFQAWNGSQKKRWRYQRSNKTILKNRTTTTNDDHRSFVAFVQESLEAMNDQNMAFSKNITQKELKGVK